MSLVVKNNDMPLLAHLTDLRKSLVRAFVWVLLGFCVCYIKSETIYEFLARPILQELKRHQVPNAVQGLYFTTLVEPFLTHIKISFYAGLLLASPFVFFEIWRFVSPGLLKNERAPLLVLALFSSLFFLAGIWFCYALVFPQAFGFFLSYASAQVLPMLSMNSCIDFISKLLLGFGVVFQLPVVVVVLAAAGIVRARSLWATWRYAMVVIAIASAALTPPDVASMVFMMAPLSALYFVSIGLAFVFEKRRAMPSLITDTGNPAEV